MWAGKVRSHDAPFLVYIIDFDYFIGTGETLDDQFAGLFHTLYIPGDGRCLLSSLGRTLFGDVNDWTYVLIIMAK